MIKRVYVDIDNTLNMLAMYILKDFGFKVSLESFFEYPEECGYDIVAAVNEKTGRDAYHDNEFFWSKVDSGSCFFAAPQSPEAQMIMGTAELMVGSENVYLCTIPTTSQSAWQKMDWVASVYPAYKKRLIITHDKSLFANSESLLIDDSQENIEAFIEAGGHAVLVPRPWNGGNSLPSGTLRQMLLRMVEKAMLRSRRYERLEEALADTTVD